MEIKNVQLDQLKVVEEYILSFPLKPELYNKLREKFSHLPFLIINRDAEIVFGIDYYHSLSRGVGAAHDVVRMDISPKEALFLNYNLKEALTGLNLYEKLVFLKRVQGLAELREVYEKTAFDVTVNRELEGKLDLLLSTVFRAGFVAESIGLKAALKLCDFADDDRDVLLELFEKISFSSSHQLKILEMAEEILFRDKCMLADVFAKLGIEKYLEMEKPQKVIIDELFKYRSPVYVKSEEQWKEEIKNLKLPGNMKVVHYPFFEKKQLELTINLKDAEELKRVIEKFAAD
ncbi:MAG: hypothetical protein GY950_31895 [bacterium]|nr:hypothetical protein [bacterium]